MKNKIYILLIGLLFSFSTLTYAQNGLKLDKQQIIEHHNTSFTTGVTDSGREYILFDDKNAVIGYLFTDNDICYKYVVFPKNKPFFDGFRKQLSKEYLQYDSNTWIGDHLGDQMIIEIRKINNTTAFVWSINNEY